MLKKDLSLTYKVNVALKEKGGFLKGFIVRAIVPCSVRQPLTSLLRDEVLPYKMVIISTHALPRHPRGRGGVPMVKTFNIINTHQETKCIMNMWVHPKYLINLTQRETH